MDEITLQLEFEDDDKGQEYEVERICHNKIYTKEADNSQLIRFYY